MDLPNTFYKYFEVIGFQMFIIDFYIHFLHNHMYSNTIKNTKLIFKNTTAVFVVLSGFPLDFISLFCLFITQS